GAALVERRRHPRAGDDAPRHGPRSRARGETGDVPGRSPLARSGMSRLALRTCLCATLLAACNKPGAGDSTSASASEAPPAASEKPAPSLAASVPANDPTPPAKRGPLNVLLLSIDSLRQDMPWTG